MIVYGVAANVSIAKLFMAGVIPRLGAGWFVLGLHHCVGSCNKDKIPASDMQ
jgi:TRAP-type C4-dicarboxylate transport system permease large subunit